MSEHTSATRVSDAERREVVERLTRACGEGRLEPGEFDARAAAAWAAVVRADLVPLTGDLPDEAPAVGRDRGRDGDRDRERERVGSRDRSGRPGLRAAAAVWAVVSALNLAIWAVVSLAVGGPVHPWWIWVAGPWGAVLALHAAVGRSAPGLPAGFPLPPLPTACGRR